MSAVARTAKRHRICDVCSIPVDAEYFDDSGVINASTLTTAEPRTLAHFELPPQYCGILIQFFQLVERQPGSPERAQTPGLQWTLTANGHPLYPYIGFDSIINPWGTATAKTNIRLDEGARIELVVRRVGNLDPSIDRVGGRIHGRYWYNAIYGDVA